MDNDKNTLTNRMSSTQSIVHSLESQLSKANKTVRKYQDDIYEKESEISKVKLLLEESEKSKAGLQTKLEERLLLCGEFEEKNSKLEDGVGKVYFSLIVLLLLNLNLGKVDKTDILTRNSAKPNYYININLYI